MHGGAVDVAFDVDVGGTQPSVTPSSTRTVTY